MHVYAVAEGPTHGETNGSILRYSATHGTTHGAMHGATARGGGSTGAMGLGIGGARAAVLPGYAARHSLSRSRSGAAHPATDRNNKSASAGQADAAADAVAAVSNGGNGPDGKQRRQAVGDVRAAACRDGSQDGAGGVRSKAGVVPGPRRPVPRSAGGGSFGVGLSSDSAETHTRHRLLA